MSLHSSKGQVTAGYRSVALCLCVDVKANTLIFSSLLCFIAKLSQKFHQKPAWEKQHQLKDMSSPKLQFKNMDQYTI